MQFLDSRMLSVLKSHLNGMHAKSCEGLDVSVAVVDGVDVFVQRSDVDEPSCLKSNPSYRYPKGWS